MVEKPCVLVHEHWGSGPHLKGLIQLAPRPRHLPATTGLDTTPLGSALRGPSGLRGASSLGLQIDQSSRKKKLLESKAQSNAFGCIQPTPLPSTLLLFTVTCESWLSNTLISVGMLVRVLVKYFYILLETKVSVRQKNSRHKPMAYFSSTVKFQHNKPISPVPQSL